MEDKKFNITIPESYNGAPIEIRFLEGSAPETFEYEKITFSKTVSIGSIAEYVFKKPYPTPVENNPAVIIYSLDHKGPSLNYHENPNDSLSTQLRSSLTVNPDLNAFRINSGSLFSQKDLEKLILNYSHCFPAGTVSEIRKQLLNFEIKFEAHIERKDDRQGATKDLVENAIKMVSGTVPSEWKISLPLYKAQKKVDLTLLVEIEKMPNGNTPGFCFYCLELEPLMRQMAEDIIMAEVAKFENHFVCLEVE